MTPIQERVKSLEYRMNALSYETDQFRWDYTAASDDDVLNVFLVAQDTLDGLSQVILKIVKPQYRRKIKNQISYLIGLRHRQQEAWAAYIEDCQNRTNNTNQWVQLHTR